MPLNFYIFKVKDQALKGEAEKIASEELSINVVRFPLPFL